MKTISRNNAPQLHGKLFIRKFTHVYVDGIFSLLFLTNITAYQLMTLMKSVYELHVLFKPAFSSASVIKSVTTTKQMIYQTTAPMTTAPMETWLCIPVVVMPTRADVTPTMSVCFQWSRCCASATMRVQCWRYRYHDNQGCCHRCHGDSVTTKRGAKSEMWLAQKWLYIDNHLFVNIQCSHHSTEFLEGDLAISV